MQQWQPDLASAAGPKYLAIADALARDIGAGILPAGARLPPQRSLAEALGVDLTTVTRAYGEAQRLGLIEGEGRRGSFVRERSAGVPRLLYREPADAGMNAPPELADRQLVTAYRQTVMELLDADGGSVPFQYQPTGGLALAREAGAGVLGRRGIPCQEDTVLVTAGGQHALHAVISAELQPGDMLAVGRFAYPGLLALSRRYGLRLVPIPCDEGGIDPDALDRLCGEGGIKAVYVVPTNDNPTTATLDEARRHALAAIARKHGLAIVEDDAYGMLPERPLPPIASIAPERTWHIASTSKILSPGLRVAWLAAPDVGKAWRLASDMHETAIMAPPLNAAIVAAWVGNGTFDRLAAAIRAEARTRQRIAASCLAPGTFRAEAEGYHLWLPLARNAHPGEIVNTLRPQGLSIVAGEAFAVDRGAAPPALRVSIGGSIAPDRLERALRLLGALTAPDATRKVSLI